ncbi:LysR family transcriptional regulator [Pseudomonas matsuisoli]|uniref:LysR family transcriptional regulator n=1 Tax=Pseudomonas matsuisoli TaxID=1515666 RepID=A0A917UXJ1_9PSED|nr:LysR family transcriptional regulator [Pseudomonas matsuisoli]GGJ93232.1 LysR family transcriptional regulator [Pseudomonas matsuisoli]
MKQGKESITSTDDLAFFQRVASGGSLTAVARELGLSLAAVSKRLTVLEQRLGVQLVRRTTRRLDLTPEGQLYLEGARPILRQLEELESAVAQRQPILRGRLQINASFGFGRRHIAPLLSAFAAAHPHLELSLQLSAQPVSLQDASVDIDLRFGEPPDSRLVAHRLLDNPRVLCASPAYLERAGTPTDVAQLAQHNCIVLRQYESDYAVWRFSQDGKEFSQKVSGTLSSNDGEVAMRLALDGHGLILRSRWDVQKHVQSGELIALLTDYEAPRADLYAVYQHRRHVPPRFLAFIRHLAAGLSERLG